MSTFSFLRPDWYSDNHIMGKATVAALNAATTSSLSVPIHGQVGNNPYRVQYGYTQVLINWLDNNIPPDFSVTVKGQGLLFNPPPAPNTPTPISDNTYFIATGNLIETILKGDQLNSSSINYFSQIDSITVNLPPPTRNWVLPIVIREDNQFLTNIMWLNTSTTTATQVVAQFVGMGQDIPVADTPVYALFGTGSLPGPVTAPPFLNNDIPITAFLIEQSDSTKGNIPTIFKTTSGWIGVYASIIQDPDTSQSNPIWVSFTQIGGLR